MTLHPKIAVFSVDIKSCKQYSDNVIIPLFLKDIRKNALEIT